MLLKFEIWAEDASDIMTGKGVFEDVLVKDDDVSQALFDKHDNNEVKKQVLELIFSSFSMITCRMVGDHITGDRGDNVDEVNSVPKTNVTVERDFGIE